MLLRFVVCIMWIGANIFVVLVVCSLRWNEIGDAGAGAIADALKDNKTLTVLK
jgi:hypothetical protein